MATNRAGVVTFSAMASTASSTLSSEPGRRWPYRSRTVTTDVWPARTATSLGLAPAPIHNATAVWRRSWMRSGLTPAATVAGVHTAGRDERALDVEWPVSGVVVETELDPELVGQFCEVNPRYAEDLESPRQSGLTLAIGARRETTDEWIYLGFGVAGIVRG
jgi:hypothetical protein